LSNQYGPASEKQRMFLTSTADIIIYGGGAGCGKSHCALLKALGQIKDQYFRAVFIRQTRTQLLQSGGLFDEAKQMYKPFKPKFHEQKLSATFPSGSVISFAGLDRIEDRYNFDGGQYSLVVFDEAQHQQEISILYLMSRLRSKAQMSSQLVMTCNPLYNSFLRSWVEWHLDPETGIPIPERDGVVRYFTNDAGKVVFALTKEEMKQKCPHIAEEHILTISFISATIFDNPIGIQKNPKYLAFLLGLKRVEKMRLLEGSWYAKEEAAGYFKGEWLDVVSLRPVVVTKRVRAWDISGSIPSESNPNPDWTAGVLMSRDKIGRYYIEDCVRFRDRAHGVLEQIIQTAIHDGQDVDIVIPADPGAAGKAYAQTIIRELAERGFYARMFNASLSKVLRFQPFSAIAEAKHVSIVRGPWNDEYLDELEAFDGSRKNKDDMVDATSDAFKHLAQSTQIPTNFVLPDLRRDNHFNI
jgi:predicted phage terminase large subunit-like protein